MPTTKNLDPATMTVHLMDDRRVIISPYSIGNGKVGTGPGIYTYSRRPGKVHGTCPGATGYCETVCYAKRVEDNTEVWALWGRNGGDVVPPVPDDATLVRWHVSGDFDTILYVKHWLAEVRQRPDVTFFGYTRSWRVGDNLGTEFSRLLLELRDEPNVTLFASVDPGTPVTEAEQLREAGWRLSHILPSEDWEAQESPDWWHDYRFDEEGMPGPEHTTMLVCPEQRGAKPDCASCGYCFRAQRGDVVFIEH